MPDPLTDRLWALSQRWRAAAENDRSVQSYHHQHKHFIQAEKLGHRIDVFSRCADLLDAEIARMEAEQPHLEAGHLAVDIRYGPLEHYHASGPMGWHPGGVVEILEAVQAALSKHKSVQRGSVPPPTPDGTPRPEGTMKTAFMAGWHAGFQEALLEDRHPDQDRAEVAWCEFLVDCNTDGFQSEG